jgi:hypothetical protein
MPKPATSKLATGFGMRIVRNLAWLDGRADGAERLVGRATDGGNRGDANHHDEGQHDRVFNGRWAIFTLQEVDNVLQGRLHEILRLGTDRLVGDDGEHTRRIFDSRWLGNDEYLTHSGSSCKSL